MLVDDVVALAKEVENGDPVYLGHLQVDEESLFRIAACQIVETYDKTDPKDRVLMSLATMTKLAVENAILHLKLAEK